MLSQITPKSQWLNATKVFFLLTSQATLSWQGRRDEQELLCSMQSFRDPVLQGPRHLPFSRSSISWMPWSPLAFGVLHWIFCICLAKKARVSSMEFVSHRRYFRCRAWKWHPSLPPTFHLPKLSPNCKGD